MIAALATALLLGQAEPAKPPPVQDPPRADLEEKRPPPRDEAAGDPDEDVIRNLELLEDLELLEHADAFDPKADD